MHGQTGQIVTVGRISRPIRLVITSPIFNNAHLRTHTQLAFYWIW